MQRILFGNRPLGKPLHKWGRVYNVCRWSRVTALLVVRSARRFVKFVPTTINVERADFSKAVPNLQRTLALIDDRPF